MATLPQPPDDTNQSFSIEYEQEEDGRWLAEVPDLPRCASLLTVPSRRESPPSLFNFREHVAQQ